MPKDPTPTPVAVAWPDPITDRINLALTRTDGETAQYADGWDCTSRAPTYYDATLDDEDDSFEPTRPSVTLTHGEAAAIRDALDRALSPDGGARTGRPYPEG